MAANFYESAKALSEYLLFHYGPPVSRELDFPVRCVTETVDPARLPRDARALDLGCAVGRSAFELARRCREVVAIDNSAAFIAAAKKIRDRGSLKFSYAVEGDITKTAVARAPRGLKRDRVQFAVGDAMKLPAELGVFDVVLMANLIDRLPDPRRCLQQLPRLVAPSGQLIIASPYTWLEAYTPRRHWLGGRGGVRTFDALRQILAPHFKFVRRLDVPFVIREHARKYQLGISEATLWTRKNSR
ncbi:MAG TPA: putative 4-mercaptohistidine N1-methyltransferase [Verrucomicrobiae bacterium]|jgi:putative 4-mercaptohistidine N1-methyltranferase|nr:putative 4-mercaptohistidine N1-methyltransferase [Verrucomicrobiae bacterium]